METSPQSAQDTRLRLLLVCVLLGAYLLVYVGAPTSVDGDALLAVAVSAVEHGGTDIDAIGFTQWTLLPIGRMGAVGVDGALYSKKGPTPSLALLPLVALAHVLPDVSNRAAGVMLNPLVTAATALVLYGLARRLNYRPYTALVVGLIFGLATMALAYSKTLFGEPLAMLLLTIAAAYTVRYWQTGRAWNAAVIGAALGLAVGVNTIYVLMIPVVGLFVFWPRIRPVGALREAPLQVDHWRKLFVDVVAFGLPIVICGAMLALYNWGRFGAPLETGYHFAEGEGFTTPFFGGLYGLFLSPYRGLFWYNPILLLSIPAWFLLRRQSARLAWLIAALVALQGAAFAGWWAWDGGIVWGPRFLLPIVPLMVLCLAPMIERAWGWGTAIRARHALPLQLVVGGFVTLSFVVQLLGALYPYYPHINELISNYWVGIEPGRVTPYTDDVLVNPALSAIVGHWRLFQQGYPLHAAWTKPEIDVIHFAAALALIVLGMVFALVKVRRPRVMWTLAVIAVFVSLYTVAARQQIKPGQQPIIALENAMQPPGVVLAATQLLEGRTVDIDNGSHVISINAPTDPDDIQAQQVWDYARRLAQADYGGKLWLMSWFGVADESNWHERWLWQNANFVEQHTIDSETDEPHRAVLFDLIPAPQANRQGGWNFGPVTLDTYGIATAADGVRITLQWSATQSPDTDYYWFVHLLDGQGNIVAQQDRAPQGGYMPTSAWDVGEPVVDRLFFPLAAGTDTAGWSLRIGWVDITNERLPVTDRDGAALEDGFVIIGLGTQ